MGCVTERKEDEDWMTLPDIVSNMTHVVKDLKKGNKCKLRVRAENVYGVSDPKEADKAILA